MSIIRAEEIKAANFLKLFRKIIEEKTKAGITAVQNNPADLLERAKSYGIEYKNGSWGWVSNIWNRSAAGSVVVDKEDNLQPEHVQLMQRVLEQILCKPMIQVDANLGQRGSKAEMKCRLYIDSQFPDIAYRWKELNFPGDPCVEPDVTIFYVPHYLENPNVANSHEMLRVLRFPTYDFSIVTASSYQGECKKGFLSHWIHHVYKKGGTGEHASLKEFTAKRVDGKSKRMVMALWGLTGSGKSTHGMYTINDRTALIFKEKFGVDIAQYITDQVIKNDDIIGVFEDQVVSPERGAWTKTEDLDERQEAMFRAATSPRALHENTEWDENGNISFAGKIFQYHGKPNQNARTVLMLEDTGYCDGNVDSSEPLNMAVFISPGYISDYAWLKINDASFAAKVLADGRTTGHPAQSRKGVGEEKYESRYCLPFTMGVGNAAHVKRFYEFIKKRVRTDNPLEVYQVSTTGRVGADYDWTELHLGEKKIKLPKTKFQEINGKIKPVGGTGPTIEETEFFLFQAARGAVKYEPHPIWGRKVLVPVEVDGLSKERLAELNPFHYRSAAEMKRLLSAQIVTSKFYLDKQCPGLPKNIYNAMDF
ncbi:MAG: phosphoenolpyruvate carboxykinase (ATP) [Candidatus Omnitrophota bacterium]